MSSVPEKKRIIFKKVSTITVNLYKLGINQYISTLHALYRYSEVYATKILLPKSFNPIIFQFRGRGDAMFPID